MKRLFFFAAICFLLSGCAVDQYKHYADAQASVADAKSRADIARYSALERIAATGDSVARVAAVMSLAGVGGGQGQQAPALAAPIDPGTQALQWAGILVPGLTQAYSIRQQAFTTVTASNNATTLGIAQAKYNRDTAVGTANAFTNMATANTQSVTSLATVGFNAATTIAAKIQAPAPNITLSGSGVIGSGTAMTGSTGVQGAGTYNGMTGSTGVLGTGTYSTDYRPVDNHAVSTSTSTATTTNPISCPPGQSMAAGSCI